MKRAPRPVDREIARFREIVAETHDAILLAEGSAHPDAALLDLCAEALHLLRHAEKIGSEHHMLFADGERWDDARRQESSRLFEERERFVKKAKPLLSEIRKLRATTGAGIYAKALVVRSSVTGAARLAMSLAEDLVACTELRATLWPSAREGQP